MTPAYAIIFVLYAFTNIHDISWGNRANDSNSRESTIEEYRSYRTKILLGYIFINSAIGAMIHLSVDLEWLLVFFSFYVGFIFAVKIILSIYHRIWINLPHDLQTSMSPVLTLDKHKEPQVSTTAYLMYFMNVVLPGSGTFFNASCYADNEQKKRRAYCVAIA